MVGSGCQVSKKASKGRHQTQRWAPPYESHPPWGADINVISVTTSPNPQLQNLKTPGIFQTSAHTNTENMNHLLQLSESQVFKFPKYKLRKYKLNNPPTLRSRERHFQCYKRQTPEVTKYVLDRVHFGKLQRSNISGCRKFNIVPKFQPVKIPNHQVQTCNHQNT